MNESQMNGIFSRYAEAMAVTAQQERVHIDAARMALALAIRDMADALADADNAALTAERDGLRQQLVKLDADNAGLTQELARLCSWTVEADADDTPGQAGRRPGEYVRTPTVPTISYLREGEYVRL